VETTWAEREGSCCRSAARGGGGRKLKPFNEEKVPPPFGEPKGKQEERKGAIFPLGGGKSFLGRKKKACPTEGKKIKGGKRRLSSQASKWGKEPLKELSKRVRKRSAAAWITSGKAQGGKKGAL